MKKKVVVGMSGGVDSSVAAYLLKQEGYDVIGVTMQIWQEDEAASNDGGCCGLSAVEDARRVAQQLDIPYYVMNFRQVFKERVIRYFTAEYLAGRTPNPCIACNRYVKWESLLSRSLEIGADYIATGHYARIGRLENGRYAIQNSVTAKKDQTYALYNLTQEQLARTLMPIGGYTKEEIRKIAEDTGIRVAHKPDSMEICFIPDNDYASFIERESNTAAVPGNFVDMNGRCLGRHKGIIHYTVGQRKGLGISADKPLYVAAIRPESNEVVLGGGQDVFSRRAYASGLNFMAVAGLEGERHVQAKIRYSHAGAGCVARITDGGLLECVFDEPQRAVTPGQALVLYDNGYVLGGGTIVLPPLPAKAAGNC